MNKKIGVGLVFGLLLSSMFIGMVSAQYFWYDLRQGSEQMINIFVDFGEPFLQRLFGYRQYNGIQLFQLFMILVLLISIIFVAVSNVPALEDYKAVVWIISIIVPLISVRNIDLIWLNTILIQYKVLAIAMTMVLPFIIYAFFLLAIGEKAPFIRKFGWALFIVIYYGLYVTAKPAEQVYYKLYMWTALAGIVMLALDGTISRWYMQQQLKASGQTDKAQHIANLRKEIREIQEAIEKGDISDREGRKIIKQKQKNIKRWFKY